MPSCSCLCCCQSVSASISISLTESLSFIRHSRLIEQEMAQLNVLETQLQMTKAGLDELEAYVETLPDVYSGEETATDTATDTATSATVERRTSTENKQASASVAPSVITRSSSDHKHDSSPATSIPISTSPLLIPLIASAADTSTGTDTATSPSFRQPSHEQPFAHPLQATFTSHAPS